MSLIKPSRIDFDLPTTDTGGNAIDPATLTAKLFVDGVDKTADVAINYTFIAPASGRFDALGDALPNAAGTYSLTVRAAKPSGAESMDSVAVNAVVVDTATIPPHPPTDPVVS